MDDVIFGVIAASSGKARSFTSEVDAIVNGVVFDTAEEGDYVRVSADIPVSESGLFARLSAVLTP